jgi:hypothetical protein
MSRHRTRLVREEKAFQRAQSQATVMKVLSTFSSANQRTADLLVRLDVIRSDWVPAELVDEASKISCVIDRFKRWKLQRLETEESMKICEASNRHYHGPETGDGLVRSDLDTSKMRWRRRRMIMRVCDAALRKVQYCSNVRLATLFEARGMLEIGQLLGGTEFLRTPAQKQMWVEVQQFEQLRESSRVSGCGHAIVQSVFARKSVVGGRGKRHGMVPHGWGVATFLLGQFGNLGQWVPSASMTEKYQKLTSYRMAQMKEHEHRLSIQIMEREMTYRAARAKEGKRGYEARHREIGDIDRLLSIRRDMLEERQQDLHNTLLALWDEEELCFQKRNLALFRVNEVYDLLGIARTKVPERPTEVLAEPSTEYSAEFLVETGFLHVGHVVEVLWDDNKWYGADIIEFTGKRVVHIQFHEDKRHDNIFLYGKGEKQMQWRCEGAMDLSW